MLKFGNLLLRKCDFFPNYGNISIESFQRRFLLKLEKREKIYQYMENGELNIDFVMKEYSDYVYVIIKNKAISFKAEDVEEIISDVFLTLWHNQEKLDEKKDLAPYIAGITKNLIKKKYRGQRNCENLEDYEEKLLMAENIDVYSECDEQNEILLQELDKMKQEEQTIFLLFYYQGKKIREISQILNISESKVKMKLSRTRKKLIKILKERGM